MKLGIQPLKTLCTLDDQQRFIWKIPPRELFVSDKAWQAWVVQHVGQPVQVDEQDRLVVFGCRLNRQHTLGLYHAIPHIDVTRYVRDTLRNVGVDLAGEHLLRVMRCVDTKHPGGAMRLAVAECLADTGLSEQTRLDCGLMVQEAAKGFVLPWCGRRAGKTAGPHGDKYGVDDLSPGESLTIAADSLPRSGVAAVRSVTAARPGRYSVRSLPDGGVQVTRLAPGAPAGRRGPTGKYDWQALAAPGGSFWVADDDLPETGTASIRCAASARGLRLSITRETRDGRAGRRVVRK